MRIFAYMQACGCLFLHARVPGSVCVHVSLFACVCTCVCASMCACACAYVRVLVSMYVTVPMYAWLCKCVSMYMYIIGERMGLSVTILLSMAVFMLLVTDMVPKTSEQLPLVGIFFGAMFLEMVFIMIGLCYTMSCYHRESYDPPLPRWMRT